MRIIKNKVPKIPKSVLVRTTTKQIGNKKVTTTLYINSAYVGIPEDRFKSEKEAEEFFRANNGSLIGLRYKKLEDTTGYWVGLIERRDEE